MRASLALVLVTVICVALGLKKAVDMSELIQDIPCMKSSGIQEVFFRGYLNIGKVDPNIRANLEKTEAAGLESTTYITPCYKCGKGAEQVTQLCRAIAGVSNKPYRLYINVEDPAQWPGTTQDHIKFLEDMRKGVEQNGKCFFDFAIFTTKFNWEKIVGNFENYAMVKLWYSNPNKSPNINDFKPFGGWVAPKVKQYDVNQKLCNNTVNLDSFDFSTA